MRSLPDSVSEFKDLGVMAQAGILLSALWLVALLAELSVFMLAPNEMMGWGEKQSLRPDPDFGWRLIESKTTRLRWQGYDYVVTSNSLGFPAPEYPVEKSSSTYRIMTVGGGFTSAEGVDTERAWPRLLEGLLSQRNAGVTFEVMNFAVTGYGPTQYAAVVEKFAPIYQPDTIIITMIPNDWKKVMTPISRRLEWIGFDRPNPNGAFAILTCQHLLRSVKNEFSRFVQETIQGRPGNSGYNLGQIWALERTNEPVYEEARSHLQNRLEAIQNVTEGLGIRLVFAFIPASVQVCSPSDLDYFPRHIDLDDANRFDLDQPQRFTAAELANLGIEFIDLQAAVARESECLYHPRNLHWTSDGHRAAADYLANYMEHSSVEDR